MDKTPKSLRIHIGLFGRTNVGKSSFLNLITDQNVSITSPVPGTTTDVVEKTMELLPVGPVVFFDTAGMDDTSELSGLRIKKANKVFDRSNFVLLIVEPDIWTDFEEKIIQEANQRNSPLIIIINKIDKKYPSDKYMNTLKQKNLDIVLASSIDKTKRDDVLNTLKQFIFNLLPDHEKKAPSLIGDLVPSGGLAVLIVPIDLEAPKGRLILPQVQTIRDALDNDAGILAVKEREYSRMLQNLKNKPDIVICDSQVVLKMVADTPPDIKCTTFSIIFARYKGDLVEMVKGVAAIDDLKPGDSILIAEACSHHAIEDDIGRVKIPRWLRQYVGADLQIDISSGRDYPEDLNKYKLIIHCGSCMMNRRETITRINHAVQAGVPITNYGVCISYVQGVFERVLEPFPYALRAYKAY